MPEGDENKKSSLFSIKAPGFSGAEDKTASTSQVEAKQQSAPKSLFDIKAPGVKKKEQTTTNTPSTSELAGSTSDLAGSTSGVSEGVAEAPAPISTPTPTPEVERSPDGVPIVSGAELAIKTIDYDEIAAHPQDSPESIPEIASLKDIKESAKKSQRIEDMMRRRVLQNPEILDEPGFDGEVFTQIRNRTGSDELGEKAVESIGKLRRERELLSTESQEALDVTPDMANANIIDQLRKANKEFNKQDLIAAGKTEEEAEDQSSIIFPEQEIATSLELGVNIDKVKKDYLNFLGKNSPDKLKDITSAAKVGNFEGQRAMDFMKDALSHQANIVDAKMSAVLSKGKENLTDEDINGIEVLERQKSRLENRYKNVIFNHPELLKKAVNERVAQQRVDESYKQAKAEALLPGAKGDKARAEVLYHQVVSPVLGASVKMVGDVVQLGINQQRGVSDDELVRGMSGIMGDWVTGFFDTEKSSSIYKKPSLLKGALFEDKTLMSKGGFKAEKLVPKVSETLFQMYALLGGGGAAGGALEAAGLGTNISQSLGLITSSYAITQNGYFQEAKSLGLSDEDANNFGNSAALLTSGLELISPQQHIFGTAGKKAFTKKIVEAINDGVDMKTAIKQNAGFVTKEILAENVQEFSQEAGDLAVKYLFNKKNGSEDFDVHVTQNELKELVLLTSIVSGGGSAHGVKSRSALEKSSLYDAAQDIDKFKEFLANPQNEKNFTPQQLADVSEKVTEYKKVIDGLPENLDEDTRINLANLVYQKKKLNESKKDIHVDETVAEKAGNDIETQVNEINGQIEMIFDEQKDTNIDEALPNLDVENKGDVEYKIGDQFFSESEIIERLSDKEFIKAVKDGDTDLSISNPSPEVATAMAGSGLLTNDQLQAIKPKEDVKTEETEVKPEAKTKTKDEAVLETTPKTEEATPVLSESINASDNKGRKGMVPTSELESFIGEDRLGDAETPQSRETIDELKEDIKKNGFKEPIIIHYDQATGEASIVEGNHRMAAAKELGLKEVPVAFEKGTLRTDEARAKDKMFPLNRVQVGDVNTRLGVKGEDLGLTVRQPLDSDFIKKEAAPEAAPEVNTEVKKKIESEEFVTDESLEVTKDTWAHQTNSLDAIVNWITGGKVIGKNEVLEEFDESVTPEGKLSRGQQNRHSPNFQKGKIYGGAKRKYIVTTKGDKNFIPTGNHVNKATLEQSKGIGVPKPGARDISNYDVWVLKDGEYRKMDIGGLTGFETKSAPTKKEATPEATPAVTPVAPTEASAKELGDLTEAIGEDLSGPVNAFNKPKVFDAVKKVAESISEETGLAGKKLMDEVKTRLSESLGEEFDPEDLNGISAEITEGIKAGKVDKIKEQKAKAKTKIDNALEKLKKSAGTTLTSGGINKESIEAVGELIAGYVELGALSTAQVIQKVMKDLKAAGIDATEDAVRDVADAVAEFNDLKKKEQPEPRKEAPKAEKKEAPKKEGQPGKKQSGFQKRTLETAEGAPAKEQVAQVVEENKQFYTVMNVESTVKQAAKNIEKEGGFDQAYERLVTEKPSIDALAVAQIERQLALDFYGKELDAAVKDGRKADANKAYKRVNALQEAISKDATKAGQAGAMLQLWKALRPDGTVEFMNRKIDDYNNSIRNERAKGSKETIGNTIDNFQEFIKDLTADQINEILDSPKGKSILDKIVAKNKPSVRSEMESKLKKRKAKVDSVVSRLDSLKIKGDKLFALPPGINMLPDVWNGSIELIKKSIQAGETMASAIDKAVAYIKENVGGEDFGEAAYRAQFAEEKKSLDSDAEISKGIDSALNELNKSIKDVISSHYTEKDALGRTLVEKLIEDSGLPEAEAKKMAKLIQNEFNEKVRKQAEIQLSKTLGVSHVPVKREVKKMANDLIEKINLGALDSDFYNGLFAEKFGLAAPLTPAQRVELKRLADIAGKQEPGSIMERKATLDMLKFMDGVYPRKNAFNTFFSLFYASMLSGVSTTVLNMWSAGITIGMKPIRDAVNVSRWIQAGRKGFESGSVKDFVAYSPLNEMFYLPMAVYRAAELGRREFAEVWKNGDIDSKFIEQVANKEFSKLNPLERDRYGKNAFKPINIKIGGKNISLNPFNYYKFSGRNLAAQDKFMFRVSHDIELTGIIREKMLEEGLRGKELKKAVIDEFTQRHTDMDAVKEQLDKEVADFKNDTGKEMTKGQRKIRLREILEKNIDPELRESAEEVGRSNIFTDDRGGLIANLANSIGQLSNKNPAMAVLLKPWVPFTKVVGNVSEYMMDGIPFYGQLRAQGLGITSLINKSRNMDIKTSQMGLPGSRQYYEQMGRAHLGTAVFLAAASLLIGTDEEDDIYITGGFAPDKFKRGRENVTPKYTIVVKGFEIPYLNIPGLAIPLAMVGNYNDRLNFGDPEETTADRLAISAFNSVATIRDMSFVKGIQDLTEMVNAVMSGEESKTERVGKDLYKKYFLTLTKPLPQNFNLIDQMEKLYDPTSYSQKDIKDITMYGLGVQRMFNSPSLDIFGETIKTLPGETLLPYAHWTGLKGNDERWKFLSKYNALQNKVSGNTPIYITNGDNVEEYRKPEGDELREYTILAGKNFDRMLRDYMKEGGFDEKEKEEVVSGGSKLTGVQADIRDIWSDAKLDARDELFSK